MKRGASSWVLKKPQQGESTLEHVGTKNLKVVKVKPPSIDIQINHMEKSDLSAVMEIERQSFTFPWPEIAFMQGARRTNPHCHFLVARSNGAPIAFINFSIVMDDVHITNFAVSPAHRRQNVGKYLLARSLDYIRTQGGRKVFLEVRISNIAALNLYRQFGFRIADFRRKYYPDDGEDAYILWIPNLAEIELHIDEESEVDSSSLANSSERD